MARKLSNPDGPPGLGSPTTSPFVNLPPGGVCFEGGEGSIGPDGAQVGAVGKPCKWWQYLGCAFYGESYAANLAAQLCQVAAQTQQSIGQMLDPDYRCGNVSSSVQRVGFCKWEGTCSFECS